VALLQRKLDGARRRYAKKIRRKARLKSKRLIRAFAEVPREHYLGPGPWKINPGSVQATRGNPFGYRTTPNGHPRHIYDDVLVGILPERLLNNGQPSGLASWFDALNPKRGEHIVHVGCGTGYYSAILAHTVSPGGKVVAVEIDAELANRAKDNLAHLKNVTVIQGDGSTHGPGPADAIFINAGATHPCAIWLDSLRLGGRLVFPLITTHECTIPAFAIPVESDKPRRVPRFRARMAGVMLLITRCDWGLSAGVISTIGIFPCIGAINRDADQRAAEAFTRGEFGSIKSLRRDPHGADSTCWLHGEDFCLSTLAGALQD
jgi:protein-L-isoaspartate(D-aspartate) O-methyltransferase